MAPDRLRTRILIWVEEEVRVGALPPKSGAVLEAVLFRGELPRGDVAAILGTRERQAQGAMTCRGGFQTRPCGVHHASKSHCIDP